MGVQPTNAQPRNPNGTHDQAEHHRTFHKRKREFASVLTDAQATQQSTSVQPAQSEATTIHPLWENGAAYAFQTKSPSFFGHPVGYRDGIILTSMDESASASGALKNGQPSPSETNIQSDTKSGEKRGAAAQSSILDKSQPLVDPKAQVDPSQAPQGFAAPLTGTQLGTTGKIGLIGKRSLQAGKQYGPEFSSAEAATEYARLGMSREWFDGPSFLSSNASQGAAIVRTQGGYAVYGTELPWGFSTQDRMQYQSSPTANDVAAKLKAVTPTSQLVALVNREGVIADYRGSQPKVEFAGLDGDAINGKIELLGPGAGGQQGTDISEFPNAVTHEAQAALDKAQHASEVMQKYVGSDYRFTPEGEQIVHKALRDTTDVNKQIIEKQNEYSASAKRWKQLIDDRNAYQGNHRSELHPDPEPQYSGTQLKAAQDTISSFDQLIDSEFQKTEQTFSEFQHLHEQRNQILKDNNAEFLARLTPEKSLEYEDKLFSYKHSDKNEVASDLRSDTESVLQDVEKMRTQMLNGDFKWWQYDPLIQQTASKLGLSNAQYQTLATQIQSIRTREEWKDLGEGALSLGLALTPGAGWAGIAARGTSALLSLHMGAKELNAYLTDRSLGNTQIDSNTARNIFASQGAPSELGLVMAAFAILPDAAHLIGRTIKALKPGEKISQDVIDSWIKSSPRAKDPNWVANVTNRMRAAREFFDKSGISIRRVNGDHLRELAHDDRAMAVFHLSKGENGTLRANIVVADDLKWSERAQWLAHDKGIHAEQMADKAMRGKMEKLADLEKRWPGMNANEKIAAKQAQLEVEIDAYRKHVQRANTATERQTANGHLAELNTELNELKEVQKPGVTQGAREAHAEMLDPPYLFARKTPEAFRKDLSTAYAQAIKNGETLPVLEKTLDDIDALKGMDTGLSTQIRAYAHRHKDAFSALQQEGGTEEINRVLSHIAKNTSVDQAEAAIRHGLQDRMVEVATRAGLSKIESRMRMLEFYDSLPSRVGNQKTNFRRAYVLKAYGSPHTLELEAVLTKARASEYAKAFVRERTAEFEKLDKVEVAKVLDGIAGKSDYWIERHIPSALREALVKKSVGFSDDWGVAFFGDSNLRYYTGASPTLGRSGKPFFIMPLEDGLTIRNSSDAARFTGMTPSTQEAYLKGGDTYGIVFPMKSAKGLNRPTASDAAGWPHYLEGGKTAVALPRGEGYLINPTREFVISGGKIVPPGSTLFKLGPNGEWIQLRRF